MIANAHRIARSGHIPDKPKTVKRLRRRGPRYYTILNFMINFAPHFFVVVLLLVEF
jgi:hypothetical protein